MTNTQQCIDYLESIRNNSNTGDIDWIISEVNELSAAINFDNLKMMSALNAYNSLAFQSPHDGDDIANFRIEFIVR